MSTLNVNNINEAGGVDAVITNGVLDSGSLPAGSVIAVKHALKTGAQATGGIAAGGNTIVTDLTLTHEVANASNKLIISVFLGAASTGTRQRGEVGLAIHDGTSLIAVGDSATGNQVAVMVGGPTDSVANNRVASSPSATFVHTPGAGSKTYTVRAINIGGASDTVYINRTVNDDNDDSISRSVSSLVIMEVAG